jgi:hypothetical protein
MSSRWLPRISGDVGGGGGGAVILAGDVTGPSGANTVVAIQGTPVDPAAPAPGDHFVFDGVDWTPTPASAGSSIVSAPGAWTVPIAVVVGDIVYATGAFTADVADRTSKATMPAIGVVIAKPIATTATLLYYGEIPAGIFPALTFIPGTEYWVGVAGSAETPGTSVAGEVVQRVGVAISDTQLMFTPDPTTTNL